MKRRGKYLDDELIEFRSKIQAKKFENNITLKDIGQKIGKTEFQVWYILNGYIASWKNHVDEIQEAVK